jgi:hypothetical protein
MAEVIRLFADRLYSFVVHRRSARRHKIRLPISVALVGSRYVGKSETKNGSKEEQVSFSVAGYTRDLSETGLGIVVSKIHIEGRYLTDQDRMLLIKLETPNDTIQFKATAKRHQVVETEKWGKGFLIGAEIKEIDEENRAKFMAYLKEPRQ